MDIQLAGFVNDSIVDGPGFRLAVFTQGCPHNCPGCHNPNTHDPAGGSVKQTDDLIRAMGENPLLDGLTLTGGEPFMQPEACLALARAAKEMGLNVWIYSGYLFEALLQRARREPAVMELLNTCDILVDGPFLLKERTLELRFRGSKNQRLIDLHASMERGEAVVAEDHNGGRP